MDKCVRTPTWAKLLIFLFCWPAAVLAAPRAASPEECENFGDMALVARALAEEKVSFQTATSAMRRIYTISEGRGELIFQAIITAAYAADATAQDFAVLLQKTCHANRGNMDGVLGTDS